MYNIDMRRETDTLKGFTIIETMLFLALTGLMLVGAMVGIGTNLSRTRYRDTVEDVAAMLRTQYDQVNRTQIQPRTDSGICDILSGVAYKNSDKNLGRGRSNCDVYGVAIIFGLDDDGGAGRIIQTNNIIGRDILDLEKEIRDSNTNSANPPDPKAVIAALSDQALMKTLGLNNVINRNSNCETVNVLDRKLLNWSAKIESFERGVAKKGIVMIIRSPRDGTVHTYSYDFTNTLKSVVDYSNLPAGSCDSVFMNSVDINDALNQTDALGNEKAMLFNNTKDFTICISSDDALNTYGRRRMLTIKADGHNSSAVTLVDMESEDNKCL